MAAPKPILYATGVTILGFICLVLACTTLFLPIWGHFEDRYSSYQSERGYFGPWKVCKRLNYGREVCGDRFRFQVSGKIIDAAAHIEEFGRHHGIHCIFLAHSQAVYILAVF